MENGIYLGKVHDWTNVYKHEDGKFYIPDYDKKKKVYFWQLTILCPVFSKTLKPLNEIEAYATLEKTINKIKMLE